MGWGKKCFCVFALLVCSSAKVSLGFDAKECRRQLSFDLGLGELALSEAEVSSDEALKKAVQFFQRYKALVRKAAHTAASQLAANKKYVFRATNQCFCKPPKGWWESMDQTSESFVATAAGSSAVRAFYYSPTSSECVVGREVAELALLVELFAEDFDGVFDQNSCHIGTWEKVVKERRHPYYQGASQPVAYGGLAQFPTQWGASILYGMSGYVGNTRGEAFLDHPADRGENFVVVDASEAAFRELIELSRDNQIQKRNNRLQELARFMSVFQIRAAFGQAFGSLFPKFLVTKKMKEMKALLASPFYQEIKVYVHDMGIKSLAEILIKLLELNPRTPYYVSFVMDSPINRSLYDLFFQSLKRKNKKCSSPNP